MHAETVRWPDVAKRLTRTSHYHAGRLRKTSCEREAEMPTGTVKWFNAQKGLGFIQPDDGSKDVFVHISAVEQSGLGGLNDGQKLAYETEDGRRPGQVSAVNLKAL